MVEAISAVLRESVFMNFLLRNPNKYLGMVSTTRLLVEFSTKGEGVSGFSTKKKNKKCKDDQNGLIHPEN